MIDLVAGHTAWDHPWVAAHPEWYLKDGQGNIIPPNPDWTDVAGLNFENQDMLQALEDDMAYWVEEFDKRNDPTGKEYYWLTGKFINEDKGEDTDEWALENGYVSVVPVHFDMTAHHSIQKLNTWDF